MRILLLFLMMVTSFAHASISVCFTPAQKCQGVIIDAILSAKDTIDIQAYHLTNGAIIEALKSADAGGVKIRILLDKTAKKEAKPFFNPDYSIDVYIDNKPRIAHNKIMIIDGERVITGSYNFTMSAEKKNAENLLVIDDKEVAKEYEDNFLSRLKVSREVN